ncbi:MAG: hypothetical protein Q8L69_07215 [Gallionellaceae bacterium]|nr:hypothetical protein [Gallionellaceae bacterium]
MKSTEDSAIDKQHRIILGKLSRSELLKLVLACERNADFQASAFASECDQGGCRWRADCFDAGRIVEPSAA